MYDYFHKQKKKTGISIKDMAEQIGCSRCHLNLIVNGKSSPGFPLAIKIEKYTNGEVKCMDLIKRSDLQPQHVEEFSDAM